MAMSTGYVADLAFLFPCGWLADRYGRVPVLLAGVLLIALTAFALPLSGSNLTYAAVGLLTGMGFACWGLPPALSTDWIPPARRGAILGVYRFMVDLGFILGPWTVGVALGRGGFLIAAWAVAGLTGASALGFIGFPNHLAPSMQGPDRS